MKQLMQDIFPNHGYVTVSQGEIPLEAVTTYPPEWHDRYFKENFQEIDPVFGFFRQCNGRSGALLMSEEDRGSPLFEEARSYGADSNFASVSVFYGNAMVFGGVNPDLSESDVSIAHEACQVEHRASLMARFALLSDSQIDFMEMSEEGVLEKQIAFELGISISAVAQRKRSICKKIGVTHFGGVLTLYSLHKWGGIVPA